MSEDITIYDMMDQAWLRKRAEEHSRDIAAEFGHPPDPPQDRRIAIWSRLNDLLVVMSSHYDEFKFLVALAKNKPDMFKKAIGRMMNK